MNKNELKDLVKNYFSLEDKKNIETPETVEEKFESAKLVDGTPISNKSEDEFEVGQEVYVTTEAGEEVLAPSGEHALDNGDVLVVDGDGKISGLHKPGETGQGSLSDELPDKGPAKILNEEEELSEVKEEVEAESNVELQENEVDESGELPLAEHEEDEEMDKHKMEIIEAIMEEMAPKIEEMKKELSHCMAKLEEHEEKMKEHYASAANESVTEKAFSKAGFGSKPEGELFQFKTSDLKAMQYENVLSRASKNN